MSAGNWTPAAALACAGRGRAIHPIGPRGKRSLPAGRPQQPSSDPKTIRRRRHETHGLCDQAAGLEVSPKAEIEDNLDAGTVEEWRKKIRRDPCDSPPFHRGGRVENMGTLYTSYYLFSLRPFF